MNMSSRYKEKVAKLTSKLQRREDQQDGYQLPLPPLMIKRGKGGRQVDLVLIDEFQDMGEEYVSTNSVRMDKSTVSKGRSQIHVGWASV